MSQLVPFDFFPIYFRINTIDVVGGALAWLQQEGLGRAKLGALMTVLVTGGAGFIGSNFVHRWLATGDEAVVNLDKLTYAGSLANLAPLAHDSRHRFVHGDIGDRGLIASLLAVYTPRAIINFAAESHVDRSIEDPVAFLQTNVIGTFGLLEEAKTYWLQLEGELRAKFRFLQISTDEVFGALGPNSASFSERSQYQPNSPYSATKAASDHLARAWHHTYGLPVLTTNCSNNYGPYQYPEKLIPLAIGHALEGKPIPVYGDGQQTRDWLYVEDHCTAIMRVLDEGRPGETYNISGRNEIANIEVVQMLCDHLDQFQPRQDRRRYAEFINFVADRPGHDRRYAINSHKIESELGWRPSMDFAAGLAKTVKWYLGNQKWVSDVTTDAHPRCIRPA